MSARDHMINWAAGTSAICLLAVLHTVVANNEAEQEVKIVSAADDKLMRCLPDDVGTVSRLELYQDKGVLKLSCIKSQQVSYGHVQREPAIRFVLPISVE